MEKGIREKKKEMKKEKKKTGKETNLSQMGNHIQWKEFSVYCLIP